MGISPSLRTRVRQSSRILWWLELTLSWNLLRLSRLPSQLSLSSRCSLFNIALRARLRDGVAIIVFSSFGVRVRVTRVKCPWAEFGILKIATQLESACTRNSIKYVGVARSCLHFFHGLLPLPIVQQYTHSNQQEDKNYSIIPNIEC